MAIKSVKKVKTCISTILIFLFVFWVAIADDSLNVSLTLEALYKDDAFSSNSFGPARWLKDGSGYTTLESADDSTDSKDIVRYNPESGEREVLVSANRLIPAGAEEPLEIKKYYWSEDSRKLLIFTNTEKVWRYHTRGDYWVLDLNSDQLFQVGKFAEESTLMFAKFSPKADRVAYVVKNNIYVETLESAEVVQLTFDGSDRYINGTFDWVYEEELDCRDGFRWSPDGESIAYWHSDTEGTGTFYLINNIDSLYSQPMPFPYPKAGTTNSAVKVGVVSIKGGEARWFDIPGDPRNFYLARMEFIPNSDEVMIQQLNRLQNTNRVWIGNINNMELNNILTDKDEAFLDIHDNIKWLDDESAFTWTSEKDGWRHLYQVSRDGKKIKPVTKGNFDVISISCIDDKGGYVYYIASPDSYIERYLYRSKLNGKGKPERISPAGKRGHFSYQISPKAEWAIATYQNAQTPPIISVIDLPGHNHLRTLEDNDELQQKVKKLDLPEREFLRVDIGETHLDAWMIKPAGFDPKKKYPLIFYVYGEPWSSTVQNNWRGGQLWHHYLAKNGYVVMSVDNRGTNVPRGRDWRKSIYGQIGILATHDQAKAAKAIFKMFPFIDTERVGIWGWSGGGSMTLNCMFRYPEIYKTGIAVAFVSDQRLYDTIYQERYMGLPDENKDGYFDGSPINHASKLEGKVLLVHGTADDNVHYQSFEKLVDELIRQNKLFSMMAYPMRAHSIYQRDNTKLHLRRTMENFWINNLTPGAK